MDNSNANVPSTTASRLELRPPQNSANGFAPKPAAPQRLWLHILLFTLTFVSATLPFSTPMPGEGPLDALLLGPLRDPTRLIAGLRFSVPLLAILLAHEMGHYITAKLYGVNQSLPFFIPAPGTYFGTMGAVIVMRSQPPSRPALLNVAVMGPYAGVLLAIPAAAWGLANSTPIDPETLTGTSIVFGSSLLFQFLETTCSPNGTDVLLHPVGLAGWVGLFITSLNLIPAGQLDGGHIAYAIFGKFHKHCSRAIVILLLCLGLFLGGEGSIWLVWALLLSFFGLRHPPVQNENVPLSRSNQLNALLALLLFIATFTPVPLKIMSPDSPQFNENPMQQNAPPPEPVEEFKL